MSSEEPTDLDPDAAGRWSRRRLAGVTLVLLLALVVLSLFRVERRVQEERAFCTSSCHHRNEATHAATPGHDQVACQSCHAVPQGKGLELAWQSFIGSAAPVAHGKVDAASCTSCHAKREGAWSGIAKTEGHRAHEDRPNVDCLSCHQKSSHQASAPPEGACKSCHAEQRLHKTNAAGAESCLSCHSFASPEKSGREPSTVACEKCHADPAKLSASAATVGVTPRPLRDVNEHALHGGVACQLCHSPHEHKPKPPAGQPECVRCHQFQTQQVGTIEKKMPEGHTVCEGCHKPHAPKKTALESCKSCHEKNAQGVPKGARAAAVAQILASVAAPGKTTALKHDSCASCHLPHTWKAERSGCANCHEEKAKLLSTKSPPQHETCTTCHDVHGAPPTGAVCVTCHAKTKGNHVARAPQDHKDCTSCHNPHAPRPEDTRTACAKCHDTQVTQVARDGPEGHGKEGCLGCHQPHENPRPQASICAKCHAERAAVVAKASPEKHRVCLSCHKPHGFKITDPKEACSRCHEKTFSPTVLASLPAKPPHQGDCKSCHTLHGSPGVPQTSCLTCHEKVREGFKPPNKEHATCKSCHEPHRPAASAPAQCGSCHEAKAKTAAMWPPESAHAKACVSCHKPHDARSKKACAECHAQEAQSAMGGKHQCMQCHPPHNPPPGTGAAWWSRCSECHAAKVESVKQRGPTHAACQNCHKPHSFTPPACATCHTMTGKGLHQVGKHAEKCTACHEPHTKSEPTRAQCLACHTNRRDHEPGAEKCQACHMFR